MKCRLMYPFHEEHFSTITDAKQFFHNEATELAKYDQQLTASLLYHDSDELIANLSLGPKGGLVYESA